MASNSASSTGNSGLSFGIPASCFCGFAARRFTSSTPENPGRPFYSCESMTRTGNHIFKWVEDALIDEVVDAKGRLGVHDIELNKVRSDMDSLMEEFAGGKGKLGVHDSELIKLRSDMDSLIYEIDDLHKTVSEGKGKWKIGFCVGICVSIMAMALNKIW